MTTGERRHKRNAIFEDVTRRVSALPGVEAAGISDYLPLERNRGWNGPRAKGKGVSRITRLPGAFVYMVTPGYVTCDGDAFARARLWVAGQYEGREHGDPE